MKTIKIAETVLDKTPEEFKNLDDSREYKLTKVASSRPNIFVFEGDSVTGDLQIVEVSDLGLPGVKVIGQGFTNYIRTSPIVKVVDKSENKITFQTEGGTYTLETMPESQND